jgi:hypothetical protein
MHSPPSRGGPEFRIRDEHALEEGIDDEAVQRVQERKDNDEQGEDVQERKEIVHGVAHEFVEYRFVPQ